MIFCKKRVQTRIKNKESTCIENSPSIRMGCSFLEIHTSVSVAAFAHLETGGNRSRQAEDDAREIGENQRPFATLSMAPPAKKDQ